MHVDQIDLHGFTSHKATSFSLPSRGIVLVTGANGTGKSSLIEAVAYAGWGKTLRGTNPWARGEDRGACRVSCRVGGRAVWLDRERLPSQRIKFSWGFQGEDPLESSDIFENNTKGTRAFSAVAGGFDQWRRTHVFSSQDAAHFTQATDGDRKRFLETLLGLGVFDLALDDARVELRAARAGHQKALGDLDVLAAQRASELQRLSDAQSRGGAMVSQGDFQALRAERDTLEQQISAGRAEQACLRSALGELPRPAYEARVRRDQAVQALRRLTQHARCPLCHQLAPRDRVEELQVEAREAESAAELLAQEADAAVGAANQNLFETTELLSLREERLRSVLRTLAVSEEAARHEARAAELVRSISQGLIGIEARRAELTLRADALQGDVALLEAAEVVLGLRGVRAHILSRALGGLEGVSNAWLGRLSPSWELSIRPYTERASGGIVDAISLLLRRGSEEVSYGSASGGERRRVDVAVLLGLAELSGGARGQATGTLWFDEVFDTLDADGVGSVGAALEELAEDRAVVVISHSDAVIGRVSATLRISL